MLTSGVVFLHDNMHLHTAACTQALLQHFNCELFDHPPYSPDLALSDYRLFTYLKNWLQSQHFNSNE
jgi:histone-lysine N-methyltransferase SETMAR